MTASKAGRDSTIIWWIFSEEDLDKTVQQRDQEFLNRLKKSISWEIITQSFLFFGPLLRYIPSPIFNKDYCPCYDTFLFKNKPCYNTNICILYH